MLDVDLMVVALGCARVSAVSVILLACKSGHLPLFHCRGCLETRSAPRPNGIRTPAAALKGGDSEVLLEGAARPPDSG